MKNVVLASVVALGVLAVAGAGFAATKHGWMGSFGDTYEMMVNGAPMTMQLIEDAEGNQFVVMSRADAEKMFGQTLGGHTFTKMK